MKPSRKLKRACLVGYPLRKFARDQIRQSTELAAVAREWLSNKRGQR